MKTIIVYYDNGNKQYEKYLVNGKRHRLNGPAYIRYYENGNIHTETYYVNDRLHRLGGPAVIGYYYNGTIEYEDYLINGNYIKRKEINEILEQCDNDKDLLKDILTIRYM